jgi:hypothetical protein
MKALTVTTAAASTVNIAAARYILCLANTKANAQAISPTKLRG